MSKFWDKVNKCKHENESDYHEYLGCCTPGCHGSESRCLDCGVFITECRCGDWTGMSGWSNKRRKAYYKKLEEGLDNQ